MKRVIRTALAWASLAVAVPIMTSCKDDTLAGTYTATTFTYAPSGQAARNVLAAGGGITLVIADNRTTSGTMLVPAGVTGAEEISVGLLGTVAEVGGVVTLKPVADSFLQDMDFTFDGSSLSGFRVVSGVSVVITLSR